MTRTRTRRRVRRRTEVEPVRELVRFSDLHWAVKWPVVTWWITVIIVGVQVIGSLLFGAAIWFAM